MLTCALICLLVMALSRGIGIFIYLGKGDAAGVFVDCAFMTLAILGIIGVAKAF